MIKSLNDKGLEQFFYGDIKDTNYPGAFLHQWKGDKEGQHSVRVSGNWRVFFEFKDGDAYIVDYGDSH